MLALNGLFQPENENKVGPNGQFLMAPNLSQVLRAFGTKFESIKVKRLHNIPNNLTCFKPNLPQLISPKETRKIFIFFFKILNFTKI